MAGGRVRAARHPSRNPVASAVNPWLTVAIPAIALAVIIFVPVSAVSLAR